MKELIRTVRLSPYRKGMGPRFTLRLFDIGRTDSLGKSMVGYELKQHLTVSTPWKHGRIFDTTVVTTVLFQGDDFACSPLHAIDSDDCVKSLMGFLCLKRGDTDAEYFKDYTPEQTAFSEEYAEYLQWEVINRFGEDN